MTEAACDKQKAKAQDTENVMPDAAQADAKTACGCGKEAASSEEKKDTAVAELTEKLQQAEKKIAENYDMYVRAIGKQYKMKSSASELIKTNDAKYYVGRFDAAPSDSTMLQYGGDVGLRFVGSAYFLAEAWSFYTNGAIRYLFTDERYEIGGKTHKKLLGGWGFVGGVGVEVSLFTHVGLFAEADYSYSPIGRSGVNVGGIEAFAGATLRTNHWF